MLAAKLQKHTLFVEPPRKHKATEDIACFGGFRVDGRSFMVWEAGGVKSFVK